jgi:hypothetical protein
VSPSPKAFSGLGKTGEPFDWVAFARTIQWQPVPQWLILSSLAYPFSQAFPAMSRAACQDPARAMVVKVALVVYTMFVPAVAVCAVYLLAGRKRLAARQHRLMANVTLALIVLMTAVDSIAIVSQVNNQWTTLGPAFASLRGACWPARP